MRAGSLSRTLRIAYFDLMRMLRKKTTILVMALFILPVIVAAGLRAWGAHPPRNELLWATMLGVNLRQEAGGLTGSLVLAVSANLFSWWWLIVALYSGDIIARDLEEGTAYLLLSRPVSRMELVAGKILASLGLLTVFAVVGAYSVYASAWILAGRQAYAWGPLVSGVALVYGSLPVLGLGLLYGVLTRKSTTSIILVIVSYFAASIIIGILGIVLLIERGGGNMLETSLLLSSLVPLDGGKHLASLVFSRLAFGPKLETGIPGVTEGITIGSKSITIEMGPIDLGRLAWTAIGMTLVWGVALAGLAYLLFRRKDL